jgi:hypothetical protein
VGILEKTLSKLRAHEWGSATNENALIEALSMDRGQQELGAAERRQAAADTLQQQLTFLSQLEELMQEQFVLYQLAATAGNVENNDELRDLREALQLSDEQIQHLRESSAGWQDEWTALQTVKESLVAMKDNEWLWNDGVATIVDQFMSILHKNQTSKFLLW